MTARASLRLRLMLIYHAARRALLLFVLGYDRSDPADVGGLPSLSASGDARRSVRLLHALSTGLMM